jgi:hypothetical protein
MTSSRMIFLTIFHAEVIIYWLCILKYGSVKIEKLYVGLHL